MKKVNWIIHLVNDVYCDMCENSMDEFLPYACNAHTHGMQQYQHPDFQLVLMLPPEEIGRILNTLGMRVQRGESFHDGVRLWPKRTRRLRKAAGMFLGLLSQMPMACSRRKEGVWKPISCNSFRQTPC